MTCRRCKTPPAYSTFQWLVRWLSDGTRLSYRICMDCGRIDQLKREPSK